MERTAFSPTKPPDIGVAWGAGEKVTMAEFVHDEMIALRDEMIAADSDEALYYVLTKISNTRWDSHVDGVDLVGGGLRPPSVLEGYDKGATHAPIKFRPDYGNRESMFLFVSDITSDFERYATRTPRIGDKLVAVNGRPIDEYIAEFRRYVGQSSHRAAWWWMAIRIAEKDLTDTAPSLYDGDRITMALEPDRGAPYTLTLPYLEYASIDWAGHDDEYGNDDDRRERIIEDPDFMNESLQGRISLRRYKGFERLFSRPAFDVYLSERKEIFLLQGHGFYSRTIADDLDALLDYARANDAFHYSIVYDLTRGGGGDLEEYTLQRLQSRPFRIMFGNLRISDITPALAEVLRENARDSITEAPQRSVQRAHAVHAPDSGAFVLHWLDSHVARAISEQQAYTSNVQFKNQFLPVTSDGFLYPAPEHFTGPMVLFTSPQACSGADQFAAMFIENNLGLSVGMPQGGCSNTWEWEEVLELPSSGKPVVEFAWTVGHSIGPANQVTEGGSAEPDIVVPLTRDNHPDYYDILMRHALRYIDSVRRTGEREPTRFDRLTHGGVPTGERPK